MITGIFNSTKALVAAAVLAATPFALSAPAHAAGDLLVAPTRIIFDGRRGTEVILNNVGNEESTYRISLVLRRMDPNGKLVDVADEEANEKENAARGVIRYAPRRVTLPPNQPQAIRLGLRGVEQLPDGEYRAHLLFRAIPRAPAATAESQAVSGLKIKLIPVYGVTIPVIIRKGRLNASASISNPRMIAEERGPVLVLDMAREGTKSVYGEIRITRQGEAKPALVARGIAVYPEIDARMVKIPLAPEQAAALKGPVTIGYYEALSAGGGKIAEIQTVIR
ncbi:MAG: molecular chaperone [Sphingorhabdus sp.]